jgi:hypothetical protein
MLYKVDIIIISYKCNTMTAAILFTHSLYNWNIAYLLLKKSILTQAWLLACKLTILHIFTFHSKTSQKRFLLQFYRPRINNVMIYCIWQDIGGNAKEFGHLSGKYNMELIVGDAVIENPFSWPLVSCIIENPFSWPLVSSVIENPFSWPLVSMSLRIHSPGHW